MTQAAVPRIASRAIFRRRRGAGGNGVPRSRRGAVALEYALVLPALLLFVLGIMDGGRLLWTHATLNRAVQAAARCGAVDTASCGTAAQIQAYAVTQAYGMQIAAAAFTSSTPACGVRVAATYSFRSIVPWIGTYTPFGPSNTIVLQANACYPPSH